MGIASNQTKEDFLACSTEKIISFDLIFKKSKY
jgi:hypothetical protein